jgi:hypothetical protein
LVAVVKFDGELIAKGGFTVTVADWAAEPPAPVQLSE